jgi:hypothetical protein
LADAVCNWVSEYIHCLHSSSLLPQHICCHLVSCLNRSAAILVILHLWAFSFINGVQQRSEYSPGRLQLIATHKVLLITQNTIQNKPFVGLWDVLIESAHAKNHSMLKLYVKFINNTEFDSLVAL